MVYCGCSIYWLSKSTLQWVEKVSELFKVYRPKKEEGFKLSFNVIWLKINTNLNVGR